MIIYILLYYIIKHFLKLIKLNIKIMQNKYVITWNYINDDNSNSIILKILKIKNSLNYIKF